MGKIVGGFMVPHDPIMFQAPEAPAPEVRQRMWAAFDICAERLAKLDATAVVIVGADHYFNFGTECLPQYLIATGDVDGPMDVMPGLKRQQIPDHQSLATHIAAHGHEHGFDWAVARAFTVDHAVAIPDRLIVDPVRKLGQTIGTIPVYIASGCGSQHVPECPHRRCARVRPPRSGAGQASPAPGNRETRCCIRGVASCAAGGAGCVPHRTCRWQK